MIFYSNTGLKFIKYDGKVVGVEYKFKPYNAEIVGDKLECSSIETSDFIEIIIRKEPFSQAEIRGKSNGLDFEMIGTTARTMLTTTAYGYIFEYGINGFTFSFSTSLDDGYLFELLEVCERTKENIKENASRCEMLKARYNEAIECLINEATFINNHDELLGDI